MTAPPLASTDSGVVGGRIAERVEYQPALDGLRAVAVLLVLVYHDTAYPIRPGGLRGGFLGVDVFFVLSGYLITSLLLAEHTSTGRLAVRSFWARRARRLLPASFLMLCTVALYAATLAPKTDLARIRGDAVATLLYVQNWHLTFEQSGSVLNHTWSLSVEEQWYLVWPALLAFILYRARARLPRVLVVIVAMAAASATWTYALHVFGITTHRLYYGTDVRAQELLIGAALAVVLRPRMAEPSARDDRVEALAIAGCVTIGAMVVTSTPKSPVFPTGGYAVFAIAVAAVIAAAVRPSSPLVRPVLSLAPLRALGLVSYGVYLYHWPIYWWLTPDRTHVSGVLLLLVRISVTIAFATMSFYVVERPVRRGALRGARLRIAVPVAFAAVFTLVIVATAATPSSLLSRDAIARFRQLASAPGERVLVVGHGLALALQSTAGSGTSRGLNEISTGFVECSFIPGAIGGDATGHTGGTLPEAPNCTQLRPALRSLRDAVRPDTVILLPDAQEVFDRRVDSQLLRPGTRAWSNYATAQLDAALDALTSSKTSVIVATAPCNPYPSNGTAFDAVAHDPARRRTLNDLLRTYAAARRPKVTLADLDGLLCRNETPIRTIDGRPILNAGGLLTPAGGHYVWDWIARQLGENRALHR